MGLGDFFNAIGHTAGKGRAKDNSGRSNAHVKDFPRDQLENAAASMQQPESGALGTFFDNLGSFFRPAGTFAAASYDAVGGEGALTRDIGALRKGSELYRGSDFQKSVKSIPIVGDIVDTGLRAPTGDFSKTLVGQGIDKVKELFTGVNPTNQDIFSDLSKTRIAHATEDSGFNDVARSIAANRQGQKQDNFVERTLGKLPVAGAYFDKLTPSVEDRAIEAGATPEQAAFISMLNPLEWLNAESKTDAAAKLEKAGTFRKALNRIASPVVDPLQAGLDWALPGKAKAVSQGGEIPSAPVVEAKPLVENAPTDAIRQKFANYLGVDVNALPLEQVAEAARPVIDEAAKPILEEAQAAPVRPSTDAVIAPSSPVDDFVKAIAPTEAPLPSEAVQEAAAPVVEDAVKPIDYTPAPLEAAKPLVDEAPPAPVQSVPPAIAAARAALNDPNIGDAVDALDEAAPTIALERAPEAGSVVESVPSYLERLHSLAQESVDLSKKKTKGAEARLAEVRAEASQIQQNVIAALGKGEGIPLMKAYLVKAERDAAQAAKKGFALKSAMRKADAELAPLLEKLSGSDFAHLVTPSNFKAPSKQEVGSYLKAVTDEGLAQAMAQYDAKVAEIAAHPAMDEAEKASAIAFQDKLIAGVKTEIKTRQAQSVVVNAVADNVRRGAEPGTSIDIATKPVQKAAGEAAKADVDRLAALEKSIEAVKNSDLPPTQRRRRLAALQQEVIALQGKLEAATTKKPGYSMKLMGGIPLPTYDNVKALGGDIKAAWDYFINKSPLRQTLKYLPEASQKRVLGGVLTMSEWEKQGWKHLAEPVEGRPKLDTGDIAVAARRLDEEIDYARNAASRNAAEGSKARGEASVRGILQAQESEGFKQGLQRWQADPTKVPQLSQEGSSALLNAHVKEATEEVAARAGYGMPVFGGFPLPTAQQLKALKGDVDALAKKFKDNTVELRASLSRWLSSTSLGKVDAKTTTAIRDGVEASDAYSRTLADAYHKVVNGDVAGIIGSKHGGVYALQPSEKAAVRDFMGGRVVNGARVDEKALQAMGLPQDVIETAKLVRGMMDQTSDALMAETHNLPLAWFTKLNDEDRALVAGLAQTASKPKARQAFERSVSPAKLQFLNEARQKVDDGFAELSAAGHWLDGEDPRDMLLAWAPYLSNRGTYQPLLYRLFEHGVLSKGDDAMQLYIQALKGKGVNVPAEVEAFLYSNWMAGGAKSKGFGNELDRIKKRNPNMPQAIKELLQEIEDPAYSYATGLFQVNRLRHQLALRRWMAGQDKFVSRAGEDIVSFMQRNGWKNGEVVELGDNVGANTRNFGAMAGRFVHRDFWDLAYQVHVLPGTAGGADAFMRFNKSILQRWKFWHTVANPASHIRQGVQNMVSIYLAGGLQSWGNMPSAISEYRTRGNLFKMARENGLLGNKSLHDIAEKIDDSAWKHLDFNAAESAIARLGNFGESIAKMSEGIRVGNERRLFSGKGAAAAWQLVDEVSRMALLKTYVDRGWPVKEAAEAVKGEVYGGVKRSRLDQMIVGIPPSSTFANLGAEGSLGAIGIKAANLVSVGLNVPFWGASRFVLEQSLRNFAGMKPGTWMPLTDPWRMARTVGLTLGAYGLHKMMQTSEGMEPADEVEQRPDYMRPYLPMHARVPSNIMELLDDKGKVGYVDLSWALPWGGLAAGGFDPKTGSMKSRGISSQLVQMSPLWKPLAEVYFNKDLFREEIGARPEIYNPLDTSASKARKSVAHLWRSYLPPWAPNLAGGALDAIRFDGGKDGRVDAKEAMRAFMQGVASDSGHTASKLASGIYNSFDYWWDKKFPDGQERLQVSDYMGREQYLVRSIADALALKITSTDLRQIEKRRKSAQTTAIKEMKHYYQLQRSNTTNPASERRLREEEAKYTQQIRAGRPVPRWYDESPEDTLRNVRQFFVDKINATR